MSEVEVVTRPAVPEWVVPEMDGHCQICGAPHAADDPILCEACGEPVLRWGWAP
jgi:hypothetical protein